MFLNSDPRNKQRNQKNFPHKRKRVTKTKRGSAEGLSGRKTGCRIPRNTLRSTLRGKVYWILNSRQGRPRRFRVAEPWLRRFSNQRFWLAYYLLAGGDLLEPWSSFFILRSRYEGGLWCAGQNSNLRNPLIRSRKRLFRKLFSLNATTPTT